MDNQEVNKDYLGFYQETTRKRGYPPFPIELALRFGIETEAVIEEITRIRQYLFNITLNVELAKQCRPDIVNAKLPPKKLPPAAKKVDLKKFQGRNGWPNQSDRMIYWYTAARNMYVRGSVDFIIHDEQIALTPETEAWFYSADAVQPPNYKRGTRCFLEKAVEETTKSCETDRAKAMALIRLIADTEKNPYRHRDHSWKPFWGGSEEEVLRKGWSMCNEITRVLVFLCQIAGLPARSIFFYTNPLTCAGSHAATEIFFDGKWNLAEQNSGLLFMMEDGYFASAVELRDNPDIVNSRSDTGGGNSLCHASFTGPISIILYSIDNVNHYDYPWQRPKIDNV